MVHSSIYIAINSLAVLNEMWFLIVFPVIRVRFPSERTAGVSSRSITVTNRSNSLIYTGASSLGCTSPLAVITVIGLLDVLMVTQQS